MKLIVLRQKKAIDKWEERPRNTFQAVPIFIYNPTKDTMYLNQQDGRVIMIQEAKDEKGQWETYRVLAL